MVIFHVRTLGAILFLTKSLENFPHFPLFLTGCVPYPAQAQQLRKKIFFRDNHFPWEIFSWSVPGICGCNETPTKVGCPTFLTGEIYRKSFHLLALLSHSTTHHSMAIGFCSSNHSCSVYIENDCNMQNHSELHIV